MGLRLAGVPHRAGGIAAALDYLAGADRSSGCLKSSAVGA
jgi:hypothetical protein